MLAKPRRREAKPRYHRRLAVLYPLAAVPARGMAGWGTWSGWIGALHGKLADRWLPWQKVATEKDASSLAELKHFVGPRWAV